MNNIKSLFIPFLLILTITEFVYGQSEDLKQEDIITKNISFISDNPVQGSISFYVDTVEYDYSKLVDISKNINEMIISKYAIINAMKNSSLIRIWYKKDFNNKYQFDRFRNVTNMIFFYGDPDKVKEIGEFQIRRSYEERQMKKKYEGSK